MCLQNDPQAPSKNDRLLFFLICCGLGIVFLFAILPSSFRFPGALCPSYRWLELNCPGCGLTRAIQALSHGDLSGALHYNPLVIFVAPYLSYLVTKNVACVLFKRRLRLGWPTWFVNGFQFLFAFLWFALAFVRTATWFYPEINPNNILIPYESH